MFKFEAVDVQRVTLQDDYRWLNIIQYRFSKNDNHEFNSVSFFADFIASSVYQYAYLSPEWQGDSGNAHGPFAIEKILPSQYTSITKDEFQKKFFSVLNDPYYTAPSQQMLNQIAQLPVVNKESLLYFTFARQHHPTALHNNEYTFDFVWSYVFWEFVEFAIVDLNTNSLYLAVFGFD